MIKVHLYTFLFLVVMLTCENSFCQEMGFKEIQLTNTEADNRYASYNKEGTQIVFESNRDGHWQIYTMGIDGENQKRLINSTANDRRPKYSPYKNAIIFESDRNGTSDIFVYYIDSETLKQLPIHLDLNKHFPEFAPNGMEITFSAESKNGASHFYKCSANGKRLKKILADNYNNLAPNLSPRGDQLVYFSNKNTQAESNVIYTKNIITNEENRLTYFVNNSEYPSWSNIRGSRIVYSAKINDMLQPEIFIMRNDGTHKIQITYNDFEDILPVWSPNNINLLITGYRNKHYQICKILLKEPLSPDQKALD